MGRNARTDWLYEARNQLRNIDHEAAMIKMGQAQETHQSRGPGIANMMIALMQLKKFKAKELQLMSDDQIKSEYGKAR